MTLIVTFENVRFLMMEKHSMPPDFKLKIKMPKKSRGNPAMDQLKKLNAEFGEIIPADRKIEAVQFLRELCPGMGLAEAKFNVEASRDHVLAHIKTHKKWPHSERGYVTNPIAH